MDGRFKRPAGSLTGQQSNFSVPPSNQETGALLASTEKGHTTIQLPCFLVTESSSHQLKPTIPGCSVSPSPGIGFHLPTSGRIFYILRPSGSLFRPYSLDCHRMKHKSSADRVAFQPNGQVHG